MNSSRPYLLRAIHQWIVDNGCTPYLLVDANAPGVDVPRDFIENEKIILNISPAAAHHLVLGDEEVAFRARFNGKPMEVVAPVGAVLAIYARENGQGMLFTEEASTEEDSAGNGENDAGDTGQGSKAPHLKVIK